MFDARAFRPGDERGGTEGGARDGERGGKGGCDEEGDLALAERGIHASGVHHHRAVRAPERGSHGAEAVVAVSYTHLTLPTNREV